MRSFVCKSIVSLVFVFQYAVALDAPSGSAASIQAAVDSLATSRGSGQLLNEKSVPFNAEEPVPEGLVPEEQQQNPKAKVVEKLNTGKADHGGANVPAPDDLGATARRRTGAGFKSLEKPADPAGRRRVGAGFKTDEAVQPDVPLPDEKTCTDTSDKKCGWASGKTGDAATGETKEFAQFDELNVRSFDEASETVTATAKPPTRSQWEDAGTILMLFVLLFVGTVLQFVWLRMSSEMQKTQPSAPQPIKKTEPPQQPASPTKTEQKTDAPVAAPSPFQTPVLGPSAESNKPHRGPKSLGEGERTAVDGSLRADSAQTWIVRKRRVWEPECIGSGVSTCQGAINRSADYIFLILNGRPPEMYQPPFSEMNITTGKFDATRVASLCDPVCAISSSQAVEFKRPKNKGGMWSVRVFADSLEDMVSFHALGLQLEGMPPRYADIRKRIEGAMAEQNPSVCQRIAKELSLEAKATCEHPDLHEAMWQSAVITAMKLTSQADVAGITEHVRVAGTNGWQVGNKLNSLLTSALPRVKQSSSSNESARNLLKDLQSAGVSSNSSPVYQFNSQLSLFSKKGDVRGARSVLDEIRAQNIDPDHVTFNSLLSAYSKSNDVAGARGVLAEMRQAGLEPNKVTFNTLLAAYAKAKDVAGANGVMREMRDTGLEPDMFTWSSLLSAYSRVQDLAGCKRVFQQIKDSNMKINLITYNSLVDCYAKTGDMAGARQVLGEMRQLGVRPNQFTFSSLLTAFAKSGDVNGARGVMREMQEFRLEPDQVTCCSLLTAYSKAGDTEGAKYVMKQMREANMHPNKITYNSLVSAFAKTGDVKGARDVVGEMRASGLDPNLITFNCLVDVYAKAGDPQGARGVLAEIRAAGERPDQVTYGALMAAYSKVGDTTSARKVLGEMQGSSVRPNKVTYNALVDAYAKTGDLQGARHTMQEMQAHGLTPNEVTYSSLVDAYAKVGDIASARGVMTEMTDLRLKPDEFTYASLLNAHAKSGDVRAARAVLDEMVQVGLKPNKVTYNSLVDAFSKAGDPEGARSVMQEMREATVPLGDRYIGEIYGGDMCLL